MPMRPLNFDTAAELFPAAIGKSGRVAYRRFGTAAEAVRFAIEELPADLLDGAYLQVEEARFDQSGIRSLDVAEAFPLPRRPRKPASADRQGRRGVSFFTIIKCIALGSSQRAFLLAHIFSRFFSHRDTLTRMVVEPSPDIRTSGHWRGT